MVTRSASPDGIDLKRICDDGDHGDSPPGGSFLKPVFEEVGVERIGGHHEVGLKASHGVRQGLGGRSEKPAGPGEILLV